MAIPDYQTLMLPVLKLAENSVVRIPEISEQIADHFELSREDREAMLTSGRQKILYSRMHWAKSYMGKAGLLQSERGRFSATDLGRALLATGLSRIDNRVLLKYPEFQEFYSTRTQRDEAAPSQLSSTPSLDLAESSTPDEQIEAAYATMQSTLKADLIRRVLQNDPSFFEQVIISLLVAMGYGGSMKNAATQLGRSGDGGVDGVINEDSLGLDRVYVQAKRFTDTTVGRPDVQAFVGSLVGLGATKGVFVTTSSFSSQATEFARHLSQRIILIDGKRLSELMIEYNVGVRVNRTVEFKKIDEDFFLEED